LISPVCFDEENYRRLGYLKKIDGIDGVFLGNFEEVFYGDKVISLTP